MKNCYFFVDDREGPERMRALCEECHKTHEFGWFWEGEKMGYGPYNLNCAICEELINEFKGEDDKNKTAI